jgi:hypothetical protein
MTAVKKPRFVTIEEYLAGEETSDAKHEYVGGTMHGMAAATNRYHIIRGNGFGFLFGQLRGKSCRQLPLVDRYERVEFSD